MAEPRTAAGKKLKRATQMPTGKGWRLLPPGMKLRHKAALLNTFSLGKERFAIFHLRKKKKKGA
jgi:hypothetical protein